MSILEILARLIVVIEKDAILLNKDLDASLGAIQIQKYPSVFLLGGAVNNRD